MESEERRGRVPAELLTGDAAPGATVSHFSLVLPHSHSLSISCLSDLHEREPRRHRLSRRSGSAARQGGERWGEEREERLILDAPLPASQSNLIHPTLPPSAQPRTDPSIPSPPHPAAKCVKLSAWFIRLLPQTVSCLHVGSKAPYPSPPH